MFSFCDLISAVRANSRNRLAHWLDLIAAAGSVEMKIENEL